MLPIIPTPRSALATSRDAGAVDRDKRSGRVVAPYRGVHVAAHHAGGLLTRLRAALATQGPEALLGMQSAAVLHPLRWVPDDWKRADAPAHVVVPRRDAHRQRDGMRLHHRSVLPEDRVVVQGVPCLSVTRTLVELARDPKLSDLLVVQILDGALLDGLTTHERLLACVVRFPRERGIATARRRILRSRCRVRSPQETTLRLMLEDDGIEGIETGYEIKGDQGEIQAEGDLVIPRYLLWGEYDGFEAHSGQNTFRKDRSRHRWVERRGWNVMRFVDVDLRRPALVCQEWRLAIADAPARIVALDPRRSPEVAEAWRQLGLS